MSSTPLLADGDPRVQSREEPGSGGVEAAMSFPYLPSL